jgi:hypothetical protein
LEVNGGACEVLDDGSVECDPPAISLTATPLTCNLPFTSGGGLSVRAPSTLGASAAQVSRAANV